MVNSLVSSEEIHDAKACDGILQGNARSQDAINRPTEYICRGPSLLSMKRGE